MVQKGIVQVARVLAMKIAIQKSLPLVGKNSIEVIFLLNGKKIIFLVT